MPDPKDNPLVKSVEALATQKEEVAIKVEKLVESLNAVLRRMGYQVLPMTGGGGAARRRGRPLGSRSGRVTGVLKTGRSRRRGRRAMSPSERKAVSLRMKAYWAGRKKKVGRKTG